MLKSVIFLIFVSSAVVHGDKFYSCTWILSPWVRCDRFSPEETCGTDLKTYKNKCEFSQAHCRDRNLDLLYQGACGSLTTAATTPIPQAGGDVIFDFLCTALSHDNCPTSLSPVCGTDGRTYTNFCEYEKAKCTHRDLDVASFADCQS